MSDQTMNAPTNYRAPLDRLRQTPHKELEPIAKATGLHFNTLRLLKYRQRHDPRLSTLEKLGQYFGL